MTTKYKESLESDSKSLMPGGIKAGVKRIRFIRVVAVLVTVFLAKVQTYSSDTLIYSDSRFDFSFIVKDSTVFRSPIDTIIIRDIKNKNVVQTIILPPNEGQFPNSKSIEYLKDVNFDGFSDIEILESIGAGPNTSHFYYVYNKQKKHFERDTLLERISNAEFLKNKTIRSFWASGCCYHGENIYKYVNTKPVLIVEKNCEPAYKDGYSSLSTVKVLRKGKMVTIRKKYLTDEDIAKIGFGWD